MRRAALITTPTGPPGQASTWLAIASRRGWPATLPRHPARDVAADGPWLVALARRGGAGDATGRQLGARPPSLAADDLCGAGAGSVRSGAVVGGVEDLGALADAAVALILYTGAPGRWRWLAWARSPLVVIEIGLDAHVDALGIALLVAAWWAWTRRATPAALLVARAVALPYISAGPETMGSLGEYSRHWRAHDGAYAPVHAGAERLVSRPRDLGRWPSSARLVSGRDRDQVSPDETGNPLACGLMGLALLALPAWATARGWSTVRVVEVGLGAFVLLAPALHPWYVLWLVPMIGLGGFGAWLVLAARLPLAHRPLDEWHTGGTWHDPVWTRAVEHGAAWTALAIDRWWTSGIILKLGESSPRRW